jgi:threonine/homoserine/homoserine lactone efflux protein
MAEIVNFEVFIITAVLLNITPGTDTMYIISRSIAQGRRAGIFSALGISAGIVVHTLLAAFGLSVILLQSAFLFNLIKVIGAIYLAYLGIRMILSKAQKTENEPISKQSHKKIFLQGMVTNITNPKVALFFLAFLPQFISTGEGAAGPLPFILLGLTFTLTGTLWCFITAYFSSMATNKLRNNTRSQIILNRLTGIVFIAMGIQILKTKAAV